MSEWVSLHTHDEFSTLDGANRVDQYPKYCKEVLGQKALAQTNHGTCSGTYAFFKSCRKADIKPILGIEAYYTTTRRHLREKNEHGKAYYHLILLALNNTGLKNLFKLSSLSYQEGMYYKPRLDDELLAQYNEGLCATSACLGAASSQMIMAGDYKAAERLLDHHATIFKDRFFIELQAHKTPEQKLVNEVLIDIANRKQLPLVLTSDAHYTHQEDKKFHELFLRMNTNAQPDDDGFNFGGIDCHLHSHDELASLASAQGIPYDAISNTVHVAGLVDDSDYFSDRKNHFPTFRGLPEGVTSWQYLRAIAWSGLIKRVGYPVPAKYEERFNEEMTTIKIAGMCDYLLVVWEMLEAARELDVMCGARGSGGSSLICWALNITQLDPLKYGLLVSRFVNTGRIGRPILFS